MNDRRRNRVFVTAALALALTTAAVLPQNAVAQELSIFALQGPGQASVVVDRSTHAAHIIDLGRNGDGDELLLDGKPLLDALRAPGYEVTRLTITCSHPHADHHGGIKAILKDPQNFVKEGQLLFGSRILIIDSGMPAAVSLATILNDPRNKTGVKAERREGRSTAAYEGYSKPGDAVLMESIPYTPTDQAGTHGRSLVTKITLGGKHVHMDYDDANSAVIRQVSAQLKKDGVWIDSFVVPHHGSAAHDLDPILELRRSPEARMTAVISVDPNNKYGHPAPEILAQLMKSIGKENVVLTGSRPNDRVVITPDGVRQAPYTAAMRDVFALFVLPSMSRAKATRSAAMKNAYEEIWKMMSDGKEGPPPDPATVMTSRRPPNPHLGGSAAIAEQVIANGTALSEPFDAGSSRMGRITPEQTRPKRTRSPAAARDVVPVFAAGDAQGDAPIRQISQTRAAIDAKTPLAVSALTDAGVPDLRQPVAVRKVGRPNGGMVHLTGDRLMMSPEAQMLIGSRVERCGAGLCLKTDPSVSGLTTSLRLPFAPGVMAAAVWSRTYVEGLDQLYLSINPTSRLLAQDAVADASVPSDKLHFGDDLPVEMRNNRVVTQGDIEGSVIGKILWEADVAFKSKSLGFNVLTGARPLLVSPIDITRDEDPTAAAYRTRDRAEVKQGERWCRMYWESGEQVITPDPAGGAIRIKGKAVVARGEAMRVVGGKLQSFPAGDWCDDSKAVAASLEAEANSANATGTLRDLRNLAEMQNFWRWARGHSVTMSESVQDYFKKLLEQDKGFKVPTWTSGVKSTAPVMVQYERKAGYVESELVHIRYGDDSVIANCVIPKWSLMGTELAGLGVRRDPVLGKYSTKDLPKIEGWMKDFTAAIAGCAHVEPLPARYKRTQKNEDEPRELLRGVVRHREPSEIHGGILLGKSAPLFRETVKKNGRLDDPAGRPVMRQSGGSLHFWANSPDNPISEHMEIQNASLVEAYPAGDTLRFLVRRTGDSVLRHELRSGSSPALHRGIEWFGVYGSSGEKYMEKATWPCAEGEEDCAWVTDMGTSDLERYLFDPEDHESPRHLITAEQVDGDVWVVAVQAGEIEELITETDPPEGGGDGSVIASQARALAWWGFEDSSLFLISQFQDLARDRWESEDYIAAFLAPDQQARELMAARFRIQDSLRDLPEAPAAAALADAVRFERTLNKLPLARSDAAWRGLEVLCDGIEEKTLSAQQEVTRAALAERVAGKRRLATAITGDELFGLFR